ncbi:hypothetical protein DSECCO2_461310 [anaerobic digester metagenome]
MRAVGGMPKSKECLSMRLKYFKTALQQGAGNGIVIPVVQLVNGDLRPVYLKDTGDGDPAIEQRLR